MLCWVLILGLRGKFTSKLILPVGRIQFCAIMGLRALLARGHSQILLHFLSCGSPLSSSQQWHNVFMPQISDLSSGSNQRKFHTLKGSGTSLVVQWLRIRLPMQETWVQSLVQEDLTCHRASKPVGHKYWCRHSRAWVPQLLSPCATTTEASAPRASATRGATAMRSLHGNYRVYSN